MQNEPMSLAEIARHEGISHQAVSDILNRAYKKLRKALKNKGYRLEDFV